MESRSQYYLDNLAGRMSATARLWRSELDLRLEPLGLSQARGLILHYLALHGDGIQQNELAEIVGIRGSTLVRQLDRLEADGLVQRRNDPEDRRAKTIHLSSESGPVIAALEEKIRELRLELLSDLTEEQFQCCFFVMDQIEKRIARSNHKGGRNGG